MLDTLKTIVKNSKVLQFALTLLAGVAIGALFYPTKHIEEKLTKTHQEEIASLKQQHSQELKVEQDKYDKLSNEYASYHSEAEKKISTLTSQVTSLKSKQKTSYYKIVKPDGTVEIRKFSESEVDESTKVITQVQEEFKQKVDSIEQKWENVHKERVSELQKEFDTKEQAYKKQIDTLEQSKVVDINKKNFGLEAGMLINKNYYGHVTYDVFGPFLIGLHSELGPSPTAGAGIGIRF